MALTPGAGSDNWMGLRSRRKWDKWTQSRVTSWGRWGVRKDETREPIG
jgi:hypothetical protein